MLFSSVFCNKMNNIKKICINCKHLMKDDLNVIYSKCANFPTEIATKHYMVTGVKHHDDFYYCTTARTSTYMCGEKANYYEEITLIKNM